MLGALAFKRKDCPACVDHYRQSSQVIADNVAALRELGGCMFHLQRYAEAVPVFQRLADLQPGEGESPYRLGLAQFYAHQYPEAIRTLSPLTESGGGQARALNLVAAAYEANGQTPQAVAALQRAIPLAPNDVNNYLDLATISLTHGAFKVGVDVVNAGLHAVPDSAPLYLERGVLEVQMGDYDRANADFQKAEALNPLQNYSSVALGISLLQQNNLDQSLQVVQQRLAKAPNNPVLNYLLAEIHIRKGAEPGTPAFQEAMAAAQRALRSDSNFTLAGDVLTELHLRSGQIRQAEETSRHVLSSDPNDQPALYHLIACLRKEGRLEELPQLVERLAAVTSNTRQQEADRSRFKLVEKQVASSPESPH